MLNRIYDSHPLFVEKKSLFIITIQKFLRFSELLRNVSKKFANSVAADSVLTNMSWELSAAWNKTRDDTSLISQAVKLVGSIRNSHIRHGKVFPSFGMQV